MDPQLKAYLDELRVHLDAQFADVVRRLEAHDRKLAEHDRRFDEHDRRFDDHDRRFDDHDRRFDLVAEALMRIEQRLERAEID